MRQVDLEAQNEELRATRHELERQQSQNAQLRHRLQNSQALLQEAGRMAKVGGWEFDVATRKQVWTEEIYHIHELPLSYQPTVSQGIAFYTAAARPIIERAVQRAIEHGEPFEVELDIITAKGNHRWVRTMGEARVE
ncbi:MAG: PAS domain-containing protein [Verrucomicrobiota bacterium]